MFLIISAGLRSVNRTGGTERMPGMDAGDAGCGAEPVV
jgi:hypothetical protein